METASPATESRNYSLDQPPPQPPASQKSSFMPPPQNGGNGLGELANSPQLMTMQGLAMAKDGFQLIANGQPDLAPILSNTMTDLEQLVVQSMSAAMAGQQAQVQPPPGVAPMMAPPPGMMAPPPASMPGMATGAPGGQTGPMGM